MEANARRARTSALQIRTKAEQMRNDRSATIVVDRGFSVNGSRRTLILCLASLALGPQVARAADACSTPSPECAVVGQFEISVSLGVGQRSNPIAGKSDIPLVVIPHVSYYGKRFFLENLELGYTLHDGEVNTFNLIAAPGYDRVFFYKNDLQNIFIEGGTTLATGTPVAADGQDFHIQPRRTTYLVGPEWTFNYGSITGQLNALREVTGRHDGYEVRGALAAPLIQSQGSLIASAGFTWKSSEVVQYYYGVDTLYQPGSAFSPFMKLRYARPLSERWTLNAFAHYEFLSHSIANSPIVSQNHVTTFFAGAVFRIR
jgi:MipA family protein